MMNLNVSFDEDMYREIQRRARKDHISAANEIRKIVSQVVKVSVDTPIFPSPFRMGDLFAEYFGPKNGIHLELPERPKPHEPMDFSEKEK